MNVKSLFRRFSIFTIANVYLVILAGGVVRCTGSGMGCPDWPKCFGSWIPPSNASQLPDNYKERYSHGGQLNVEFNVYKTWTEYINRLLGVFVGFFIFLTLLFSASYYKANPPVFYWSLAAFLLVGLQGWIGAKVVALNLKPFIVTVHMVIAVIIVAILLYALAKSKPENANTAGKSLVPLALCACIISVIQIISGTQVRQLIDVVAGKFNYFHRDLWIGQLGGVLIFHRFFAYIVIMINCYFAYKLNKLGMLLLRNIVLGVLILEFLSGFILVYLGLPTYIQPFHLLFASLLFGIQFYIISIFILAKNEQTLSFNN